MIFELFYYSFIAMVVLLGIALIEEYRLDRRNK